MNSFKKDYVFGKAQEDEVLLKIQNKFNDNIVKSSSKFEKYDYKGDKYYYELKSRNNKYNAYPTTLIDISKVVGDNMIFLFNFTDGLYYIKYDKTLFDTFECKEFVRHKRYDFIDKPKPYYYIPIDKLTKIELINIKI
jgi:hypothetical protein